MNLKSQPWEIGIPSKAWKLTGPQDCTTSEPDGIILGQEDG